MAFASPSPLLLPMIGQALHSTTASGRDGGYSLDRESAAGSKVFLVSNRLPYRLESGKLVRADGGLVTALQPLHASEHCYWVGNGGFSQLDASIAKQMSEHRILDVDIPPALSAKHYNGASNAGIWPLFHYFPAMSIFDAEDWDAYVTVNTLFADVLLSKASANDTIWVHDYQLMLLPSMLRERCPGLRIGYFHHIPFPSTEVLRIHPARDRLLAGLLGADVVGFHTLEYVRNFTNSVARILGYDAVAEDLYVEDRVVRVGAFPLGVDSASLQRALGAPDYAAARAHLTTIFPPDVKVIVGIDRLDYTKGLVERLSAFELFLRTYPSWQGRVVLVMLCVPSRVDVDRYSELRQSVERLVGRINGELGRTGWMPVHYYFQTRGIVDLCALYNRGDVCLVTPLRDGLNLVCKEYCVCHPEGEGVLVLSEFAGAAQEMTEALIINPNDKSAFASAINTALTMDRTEMHERMRVLHSRSSESDNVSWGLEFMAAVQELAARNESYRSRLFDANAVVGLRAAFQREASAGGDAPEARDAGDAPEAPQLTTTAVAKQHSTPSGSTSKLPMLMVLDADVLDTKDFKPRSRSSSLLALQLLTLPPAHMLVLVTSEPQKTADQIWPADALRCWVLAERGSCIRSPDGQWRARPAVEPLAPFEAEVLRTLKSRARLVPASTVLQHSHSTVWELGQGSGLSLAAPILLETVHVLDSMLAKSAWMCVRTVRGLTVRPSHHTVASALTDIQAEIQGLTPTTRVISIGSVFSDQSLFTWLPANSPTVHSTPISISVGSPMSVARYVVPNLPRLLTSLEALFK